MILVGAYLNKPRYSDNMAIQLYSEFNDGVPPLKGDSVYSQK